MNVLFSFPGGKKDESDNSIVDVALREAEEEISISKDSVKVLTSFGPFTSRVSFASISFAVNLYLILSSF